ncbi:hypothetical protein EMIHUDRAFT_206141 [Emiliania huxleyi CCMP1516]|uniref:Gfo/Idh/MocA-like oxidoreductase N-terminal domain-containing protein n=2 Tax=Emiliania huxleyi TaxID=2903 RepID=A0A0D3JNI3_EMIH1|nr:hypothetical protein EMIHUDRAFT_206141 [Emiliania huxleyi CCMP1516]EOD25068.1 hypothetical protein EMIHUDRAFT_206141 [Emiliania huxleyi CCMP1516]|eukprot:XP_005777497.1 hypothetical protein EMIHUDRAFT_206141 [Emiliania huxleyi CCMP1516]
MEPERLSNREALLERISSGCHELDGPKAVGVSASLAQLDSPVRICLVGLGRAGAFHMQSLRFVGARVAQLVCVVDTNLELARRTATEFAASDCVARATLEEVMADVALAGRVDAIIIASTTDTHYGLCKLALSASKATFTEKPISHHADEVDEVICLAKAARAPLPAAAAKRREEGPEATTQGGCEQEPPNSRPGALSVGALRDLIADGALSSEPGIFHDMLSHDFDMIHFLTGEIPDEWSFPERYRHTYTVELTDRWLDPLAGPVAGQKAIEAIATALQQQYEQWQPRGVRAEGDGAGRGARTGSATAHRTWAIYKSA